MRRVAETAAEKPVDHRPRQRDVRAVAVSSFSTSKPSGAGEDVTDTERETGT
jgi:hypothetical protein